MSPTTKKILMGSATMAVGALSAALLLLGVNKIFFKGQGTLRHGLPAPVPRDKELPPMQTAGYRRTMSRRSRAQVI